MKLNFIHKNWHAWDDQTGFLLSNEETKELRWFETTDNMINSLWYQDREAARLLNKHVKENS